MAHERAKTGAAVGVAGLGLLLLWFWPRWGSGGARGEAGPPGGTAPMQTVAPVLLSQSPYVLRFVPDPLHPPDFIRSFARLKTPSGLWMNVQGRVDDQPDSQLFLRELDRLLAVTYDFGPDDLVIEDFTAPDGTSMMSVEYRNQIDQVARRYLNMGLLRGIHWKSTSELGGPALGSPLLRG